ncbi:ABC transporter ATP-binding protein [Micromonospora zamorensis]|uniref:Peptide/nickel transport system ATP-binding protein n=1 Tax=Micromonospora jinlongensis TaxID=1287877 RepID=A0A7Y9X1H6_9ACTN|nr:ABC transporter ATP-binding protein [Micromonospora jinlongensis]NYH43339.1 peptide/nickel transport system ATP-binding protein [Micromonospora jinlongensis]
MTHSTVEPTPASATPEGGHLLELRDLHVEFRTNEGVARVINGVSYHLDAGETLAVLGESGSGKSVTAQAIMGILDTPPAFVRSGQILYQGQDLLTRSEEQRRQVRGKEIAMIFQDALSALNPVFPVGWQIGETLRQRSGLSRSDARRRAIELMDLVKIPGAAKRIGDYPHQFSGGMRQRVMIAMALALDPKVLIADEPTTALDVTVQAQIMDLLADLRQERNMAMILITHDLGVVAGVADRIAVMYAGRIVEHADVRSLYKAPAHPYTKGLLESIPRLDVRGEELSTIKGLPPNLMRIPSGCPFHPRCPYVQQVCVDVVPHDLVLGDGRTSACHFAQEVRDDSAAR